MRDGDAEQKGSEFGQLELESTIGFAGSVPGGLLVHPDGKSIIYPLGNTIVIKDITTSIQTCLRGHTNDVSCVAVSKSGKYLASGQMTHMGFKADVIVWDYEAKTLYCRLILHKVKVEALAFSPDGTYLASLGGQDDGSVVIWDVAKKEAICGAPAAVLSAGTSYCVAFANGSNDIFVTGGNKTLRVWELDVENRLIRPTDCSMGQLKRIVKCIQVSEDDKFIYCGTTSGDILQINMKTQLLCHYGPAKEKFSQGIGSISLLNDGNLLLGSGDGNVAVVNGTTFKKLKATKVDGGVSSLALANNEFYAGTTLSQIYKIKMDDFKPDPISTCHYSSVLDISFPYAYSEVFATCSKNDIRVWNSRTSKELLRVVVPNMTCNAVDFMRDGKTIVSAWDDGKIRGYKPESGKLKFTIHDAHNNGVTAIATTSDSKKIISGGGEGQVRVWLVGLSGDAYRMEVAMKEHKGTVTCINVKSNDTQCVTSSTDGTCIIWDLERFVRNQIIFANTMFKNVCYFTDECQMITAGTDRKVGYWETYDGSQIRELEGTKSGSINGMDISPDGVYFVTGGQDKLIKVWKYNEGEVTHCGVGHSGEITRLKICPEQQHIVSVSADGAVLRWKFPFASKGL